MMDHQQLQEKRLQRQLRNLSLIQRLQLIVSVEDAGNQLLLRPHDFIIAIQHCIDLSTNKDQSSTANRCYSHLWQSACAFSGRHETDKKKQGGYPLDCPSAPAT
jgi:hypothetical protein